MQFSDHSQDTQKRPSNVSCEHHVLPEPIKKGRKHHVLEQGTPIDDAPRPHDHPETYGLEGLRLELPLHRVA